mmetsp:Transcript_28263/g.40238  ORF Transcript_28263/g.40238 Transcript_28263/m.40238 type:complete len:199 (+) Transcript_28263:37-633(+)|eukprot:CAMPEP_0170089622 /NCGR_PEP_ID=MMETSP0019_2-20121128/23640_1 /TAXON_ID=98059 /ORGANISM="Dinobryon sp., Strain UTEXLB2267" /LENGTH=198 /DNA_ID=CAMNT_0010308537 /DNA_START=30 /DNA_END=626 /DNA_ORIENTATION=+
MSSYALLYAEENGVIYVLVALKNLSAYWFHYSIGSRVSRGGVPITIGRDHYIYYQCGMKIVNGSNRPCLPGGRVEKGDTAESAAIRELFEETGVDLTSTDLQSSILKKFNGFSVLYIKTDFSTLNKIAIQVKNSLKTANNEDRERAKAGLEQFSLCKPAVQCNELQDVKLISKEDAKKRFAQHLGDCGWFIEALDQCP